MLFDVCGVVVIEFVIVMLFMLVFYVGGVEFGNGFVMNVKVSVIVYSVVDMIM